MKHLLVTVALLVSISGCDSEGTAQDVPDGGNPPQKGPVPGSDAGVASLLDAMPGYTASGVFAALGANPCGNAYADSNGLCAWAANGGWDPDTGCWITVPVKGLSDSFVRPSSSTYTITSGICGLADVAFHGTHGEPTCGITYAPGTLLIWNSTDSRYSYHGDTPTTPGAGCSGSAGYICLPNAVPYVIPC